ncbi:carbamate kinase [candidate division KSB1 bacterium]|nr:carbamate kinase [candidate division KSB1 bacterium]NIR71844.1 carbamate kinase [candidate division KSB1 bacterium]NIS25360.1 carbamate kinase [candidate division KSB1 bacterium]NIT71830.1 carbamate kinase [candidate division KSB1 bacterium]NIU25568.1 carbamate kinase [candidate division KSB1 bacterium]
MRYGPTAVVALGGNAITREFEEGNITQQWANTRSSLVGVVELIKKGYRLAITHGNGPQVGNNLIRVEATRHMVPPLPLGVIVADLQGGMGYMIQQSLQNKLKMNHIDREVCTVLTQVLVDKNDPSILNPTKFVGPFIKEEDVDEMVQVRGWAVKEDPGRGYRRVVPSPSPLEIVEKEIINFLIRNEVILICSGGGGIPVYIEENGTYEGVDGVIDKDLAASVLAKEIEADELYILTAVDKVALNYRKPNEIQLDKISVDEARQYMEEGHFPKGSMGPKIQAAINFIEAGGKVVVIGSVEKMKDAIKGKTGTRIEA